MINGDVKIELFKINEVTGTLDLYDKTEYPLALNFGIKNIININDTTGTYSKTLKVPATKNNNKIFREVGFDNSINVVTYLDNSIECRISLNNRVLVVGSVQVKGVTTFERIDSYELTILGSNISWSKLFSDEFMCDVDDNYDNNATNVWNNATWKYINDNTNLPYTNNFWCMPIICWGEWQKNYNNSPYMSKMDLSEARPAYFIKALIYSYFKKAGYHLESQFFQTTDFEKLIIPTTLEDWSIMSPELAEYNRVKAEFKCIEIDAHPFPDAVSFPTKARYISKDYEGRGWDLFVPFDVEIQDNVNAQTIAKHDINNNDLFGGGTYNSGGFTHLEPNKPHTYIAPSTAMYDIKVELSIARQGNNDVRLELLLFRDKQDIWDNDPSVSVLPIPPAHPTNPLYTKIIMNGGCAAGEPIVLDSHTCPSTVPMQLALDQDAANLTNTAPFDWEFYNYEEVNLNSGQIKLEAGDMVVVFAINNWGGYVPWMDSTRGKCYVITDETPEYFGGLHKIWNYPTAPTMPRPTTFEVEKLGIVAYGDTISIKEYLPCTTPKIDLIKAITGMFNLYWTTDELSKIVICEPYDDFYKNRTEAIDFSDKLDFNKPQITKFITDDINKSLYFKYAQDSQDGYVEEVERHLEQEFLSLKVDMQDGFVDAEEVLGNEVTAPTFMFSDWELTRTTSGPRIPLIVGEYVFDIEHSTKPEVMDSHLMRILSYEGMQPLATQGWGSWDWTNSLGGLVSEYPAASTFSLDDTTFNNLDWADNIIPGLYTTYWSNFINKLSESPRIKTVYLQLEANDISLLDFSKPIFIKDNAQANGGYWLLHKIIDYKPHNQDSTKVELLQYAQAEEVKGLKPNSRKKIKIGKDRRAAGDGRISVKTGGGNGRTNEDLILKGGNKSIRNNGNIMLGSNLTTRKQNQVLIGQFNKKDDDAILIVGGGTSEDDRRNILVVDSKGTLHFGENGGGGNMVTKDDNGNIIDLYTEEENETIIKVFKG